MASLDDLLDVVGAQENKFNNLMIVGHNPGLTTLANYLSPGLTNNLPTAGVVCVAIDQDDWAFHARPTTKLVLYDFPKNTETAT